MVSTGEPARLPSEPSSRVSGIVRRPSKWIVSTFALTTIDRHVRGGSDDAAARAYTSAGTKIRAKANGWNIVAVADILQRGAIAKTIAKFADLPTRKKMRERRAKIVLTVISRAKRVAQNKASGGVALAAVLIAQHD